MSHVTWYTERACEGFFSNTVNTSDTAQAEKDRHVALAPAEKDYPCILLTLVIVYLLHIIFLQCSGPLLPDSGFAARQWLTVWGHTCVSLKPTTPSPPLRELLPALRHLVVWGL